jgi:8-oxo-dGTP pyrophosphatase MutT (NUDIX family)
MMIEVKPVSHYVIHTHRHQLNKQPNRAFNSLSFRGKRGYSSKNCCMKEGRHGKTFGGILMVYSNTEQVVKYALVQGRATGKWSFPKGHSNPGEAPLECAKREIAEETSIEILTEPTEYIKMGYGQYYVFELAEEQQLVPRDTAEVMDTKWVTMEEIVKLPLNADVSQFVRNNLLSVQRMEKNAEL